MKHTVALGSVLLLAVFWELRGRQHPNRANANGCIGSKVLTRLSGPGES